MQRPRLYLFVGYPGAGKTTAAHIIEEATGAVHLWSDRERQKKFTQVTHSAAESSQLYDALNQRTEQLLAAGNSVIFDTNFNYVKDRQKLRDIATKHNAQTVVIWLQTPIEIARARALDADHRDRNHYQNVMTAEHFAELTCRLEAPTKDENVIKIDGSDIDIARFKQQLGI